VNSITLLTILLLCILFSAKLIAFGLFGPTRLYLLLSPECVSLFNLIHRYSLTFPWCKDTLGMRHSIYARLIDIQSYYDFISELFEIIRIPVKGVGASPLQSMSPFRCPFSARLSLSASVRVARLILPTDSCRLCALRLVVI